MSKGSLCSNIEVMKRRGMPHEEQFTSSCDSPFSADPFPFIWPPYTQAAFRAFSQRSCCASYRSFSQATA